MKKSNIIKNSGTFISPAPRQTKGGKSTAKVQKGGDLRAK